MRRMMFCFSSQHEDDEKEGMTHLVLNHPTRADYCIFIIYAQHRVSQLLSGSQTSEFYGVLEMPDCGIYTKQEKR